MSEREMEAKDAATVWAAWHEMNAVRARDGVPYGHVGGYIGRTDVSYEYWSNIVDRLGQMLGPECQPWPSERMKPFVPSWSEYEREAIASTPPPHLNLTRSPPSPIKEE